ncbi:copper chaperone PCu(A)C [Nocardia lijiangensis]|uniref:copper chaperone PCu(A)C n=1 Tax=Nocardia lijiangensis TaxID=299618 RepID=UPI0008304312|nr:copper chaperone PCu(A)C [Nocardia lijiangensis]
MFPINRTRPAANFLRGAAALAAAPLLLVACSSTDSTPAPARAADAVTIQNQWIKAAHSDMSAAFGELTNTGDKTLTVVSATSPASARVELHEVVADASGTKTMRPKKGGFVIPPRGSHALAPGADHIMFMGLNGPLRTGSETPVTLSFDDGSTMTFTAQVRDFPGNQENYVPDGDHQAGAPAPALAPGA